MNALSASLLAIACLIVIPQAQHNEPTLTLSLSNDYSTYDISLDGQTWLNGGDTYFRNNQGKADLSVSSTKTITGNDNLGSFQGTEIIWKDSKSSKTFGTTFRTYPNSPEIITFTQTFYDGVENAATGIIDSVISSFPSFTIPSKGSLFCLLCRHAPF